MSLGLKIYFYSIFISQVKRKNDAGRAPFFSVRVGDIFFRRIFKMQKIDFQLLFILY